MYIRSILYVYILGLDVVDQDFLWGLSAGITREDFKNPEGHPTSDQLNQKPGYSIF